MIVSTELPIYRQEVLSALTPCDFIIAPIYLRYPEYAEFYRRRRHAGRYVILDNGAFEGELVSSEDLVAVARELHPQEIVAPDVIGDRDATLDRAREFVALMHEKKVRAKIQVCPQGRNFDDWTKSYQDVANLPGVSVIGISYVCHFEVPEDCDHFGCVPPQEATRLRFFHLLAGTGLLRADKAHHLLGLFSPAALRWYAMYPFVRSIDTSFPVICALHGVEMKCETRKFADPLHYETRMTDDQLALAIRNILWTQRESHNPAIDSARSWT